MQETMTANPALTRERQIETALRAYIEETPLVNAIRGGRIVQITWNALTDEEQRQARLNMFRLCDWEG